MELFYNQEFIDFTVNFVSFQWDLFNNLEIPGYIQSIFMLGVLVGNLLSGKLSDSYGRKTVLFRGKSWFNDLRP